MPGPPAGFVFSPIHLMRLHQCRRHTRNPQTHTSLSNAMARKAVSWCACVLPHVRQGVGTGDELIADKVIMMGVVKTKRRFLVEALHRKTEIEQAAAKDARSLLVTIKGYSSSRGFPPA